MNSIHLQSRTQLLPSAKVLSSAKSLPTVKSLPTTKILLTVAALLLSAVGAAAAAEFDTSAVPAPLQVPAGEVLAIPARGVGVQIYECAAAQDDPARATWTLKAPEAEIQDESGLTLGKHYGGPTWEGTDGSKVVGEVVAKVDGPDAAAVPWLLLHAKSTSGTGMFAHVTSIQRLHSVGGKAPATGCDAKQLGKELRVPYTADYRFFTADPASPIGLWKTFDDKTGKPRGLVRIYERDGKYFGKLEESFTPGAEHRVCAVCTDERKDQPVIGLSIIRNLQHEDNEYTGGDILDPESGSVYRCKMHLEQDGTRLVVRGFIGFSLLGRSQTWQRQ
jgi:uncharacterized protein (DUF2147 family)